MTSIAILAGGQSKRMGQDKAFLDLGGKPSIAHVIERVASLTDDLFIGTNTPEKYRQFGLRTVTDRYPQKAALGGIYSAIYAAKHRHVLIVACDMPLLQTRLLRHLLSLAPAADVIAPLITPPQPETMHAIYSKACLRAIEPRLHQNKLRIISFFDEVSVHYLDRAEVSKFDPDLHSFLNMNTPQDWQRIAKIMQGQDREQTL